MDSITNWLLRNFWVNTVFELLVFACIVTLLCIVLGDRLAKYRLRVALTRVKSMQKKLIDLEQHIASGMQHQADAIAIMQSLLEQHKNMHESAPAVQAVPPEVPAVDQSESDQPNNQLAVMLLQQNHPIEQIMRQCHLTKTEVELLKVMHSQSPTH